MVQEGSMDFSLSRSIHWSDTVLENVCVPANELGELRGEDFFLVTFYQRRDDEMEQG